MNVFLLLDRLSGLPVSSNKSVKNNNISHYLLLFFHINFYFCSHIIFFFKTNSFHFFFFNNLNLNQFLRYCRPTRCNLLFLY